MKFKLASFLAIAALTVSGCVQWPLTAAEPNALIVQQYNAAGTATRNNVLSAPATGGVLVTGTDAKPALATIGDGLTLESGTLTASGGGGSYTLPPATAETLGGVKIGENLTITEDGTLSASGGGANGWTPILAVIADGERRVLQVVDWAGGVDSGHTRVIPLMTSANSPAPLSVSSNTTDSSNPPFRAFDGDINSVFHSGNGQTSDFWLVLDMGATTKASSVEMVSRSGSFQQDTPEEVVIKQGSNGTDWTTIGTFSGIPIPASQGVFLNETIELNARFVRFEFTNNRGRGYQVLSEITLYSESSKPLTGQYLGESGLVDDIALAVDIRGAAGSGGGYTLPQATKTTLGGVTIGDGIDVNNGVISISPQAQTPPYSTDETIVGTWIDGSPVYQKTMAFGTLPNPGSDKRVAFGTPTNVRLVIDLHGSTYSATAANDGVVGYALPLPFTDTSDANSIKLYAILGTVQSVGISLPASSIGRGSFTQTFVTVTYLR